MGGWVDGWMGGFSKFVRGGEGGLAGLSSRAEVRVRVRGKYRFSSLLKQRIKA